MDILIASDIFGHTPDLDRLAARIGAEHTHIIAPHDRTFAEEAQAYEFFVRSTDIPSYAGKISDTLASLKFKNRPLVLVGFSIGAAAIWLVSANQEFSWIQRAFCFYGSRIRDHRDICPVFPVDLIFPERESHFDVLELARELTEVPRVSCTREEPGLHGFMNQRSANFSKTLYQKWTGQLNHCIEQQ